MLDATCSPSSTDANDDTLNGDGGTDALFGRAGTNRPTSVVAPDSLNPERGFVFYDRVARSPFLNFRPELDFNVLVRL